MSIWTVIEGGMSMPGNKTRGQRFAAWVGRRLAARRKGVSIDPSCLISPEAKICARGGAIRIGAHSSVAAGACVQGSVSIGENCSVQMYTVICGYADSPIRIGNDVRIAAHCMMVSANHRFDDPDRPIRTQGLKYAPIVIEDDVWVASRVNIMAGVTVGRGRVLAHTARMAGCPASASSVSTSAGSRPTCWNTPSDCISPRPPSSTVSRRRCWPIRPRSSAKAQEVV